MLKNNRKSSECKKKPFNVDGQVTNYFKFK